MRRAAASNMHAHARTQWSHSCKITLLPQVIHFGIFHAGIKRQVGPVKPRLYTYVMPSTLV